MWEAYVVAVEEGVALGVSVLCLVVYPPHAHPTYACKYSTPSPWHRLFYVACAIFSIVVQVADVVKTHGHCFAFFTTWNFILQIGFWTWSIVDHRASSRLRLVLFDVLWPSSILVAGVVWGILYPAVVIAHEEAKLLNWISYCQHGINTVLLCIEWILSDARHMSWRASAFLVLFATVYVIFAWILHESTPQGFWPYPFLAIDRPLSPLVYLCLLVLQLVAFSVTLFGASLRSRAASQPAKDDSESSVRLLDEAA
ncbi:hypothetical protein Ae201684_006774 [Aphanomyces euteiches]|uniref:Uncharacterized protein n=1 Tax=Aphanomyces euteiches TaxID=100861 RepID=A0A6G0XA13_9STRA|nr:hypothetical protein Ae201684_006774 [Aphanomyces euteiches]KAH9144119.1 hypothetical protein AeRB84_011917 [Aphanomyces euteiches]